MNEGELYEIVKKAAYLREQGVDITFDHFATLRIVEAAAGYPGSFMSSARAPYL